MEYGNTENIYICEIATDFFFFVEPNSDAECEDIEEYEERRCLFVRDEIASIFVEYKEFCGGGELDFLFNL